MHIHKEGHAFLAVVGLGLLILNSLSLWMLPRGIFYAILALSALIFVFLTSFFRSPRRQPPIGENWVLAPADGRIINIERVRENEVFGDERIVISIFLSVFNVHINWIPLSGRVTYSCYHHGKYLVAFHPKSSELNERSTVVIESPTGAVVAVRQIAGLLARRIKTYPEVGQTVQCGRELGFIKFGSRVDIFLPPDSDIKVKKYQSVKGCETVLAELSPLDR